MSQWTHVCGCIRIDAFRSMRGIPYRTLKEIKSLLENTVGYEDSDEKWRLCDVPCGSEGGIQFAFWENPNLSCLSAFTVSVFVDLRDFGKENVHTIQEWFERVTKTKGVMIRNAVIEICVEGEKDSIILRHEQPNT